MNDITTTNKNKSNTYSSFSNPSSDNNNYKKYQNNHLDHPVSAGYYVIFCKETGWTRYSTNPDYLFHHYPLSKDLDYYTCYNTFKKFKHTDTNVLGLNAIWLDFDTVNQGMEVSLFAGMILHLLDTMQMSKPNHLEMSGHGFHFVWFFEHPQYVHSRKFLKLWERLEATVIHKGRSACQEWFGNPAICDPSVRNPSRLMRLDHTYNNKGYDHIWVHRLYKLESSTKYSMQELINQCMDKLPKRSNSHKKSAHNKFKKYLHNHKKYRGKHNAGTLNWDRHYDLEYLPILQHGNCNGYRDLLLFNDMIHMSHIMINKLVFKHIDKVNREFTDPLPDGVIDSLKREYKSINFTNYKFRTNKTLISELHITKAQQKHLLTIKANAKGTDQLHHQAHLTKATERKYRNQKIVQLHKDGLSMRKIAKKMKLGVATVHRAISN